ncbi:hypothetical protein SeLEV6574_g04226 [Synchytrium endobioticum]|uniref:Myb-like domain-containing protein n=1 Tax=Synchytrium endobioticum TaxID=286115 RepID=A0A507D0B6_9FUNG|nr:hypothetical protein SeLEV6574_g04226 [Synchytrium endobioticum]
METEPTTHNLPSAPTSITTTTRKRSSSLPWSSSSALTKQWSTLDDDLLLDAVRKNDDRWMMVASAIPGRTSADCMARYSQLVAVNQAPPLLKRSAHPHLDATTRKKPKRATLGPNSTCQHRPGTATLFSNSPAQHKSPTTSVPTTNTGSTTEVQKTTRRTQARPPRQDNVLVNSTIQSPPLPMTCAIPLKGTGGASEECYTDVSHSDDNKENIMPGTEFDAFFSEEINALFSDVFDQGLLNKRHHVELSSDGHAVPVITVEDEDPEDIPTTAEEENPQDSPTTVEEHDAEDAPTTLESAGFLDDTTACSLSVIADVQDRNEVDVLFKDYLENLSPCERDNILPNVSIRLDWVNDSTFGFTTDQSDTLKHQMLANFQILVQAHSFSSELYGSRDATASFFASQLSKLRDQHRHAKTHKLERSLFLHPALSAIPSIIKAEPHPGDAIRHESVTSAFENPAMKKDYDRMKDRIYGPSYDNWMASVRDDGEMLRKNRVCVSPWPASLTRIVSSNVKFFHDAYAAIVIPVRRNRSPFSEHEDELIRMGSEHCGANWQEVRARFLPARTVLQMKTRISNKLIRGGPDNPIRRYHVLPFKPLTDVERHVLRETCRKHGPSYSRRVLVERPRVLIDATLRYQELCGELVGWPDPSPPEKRASGTELSSLPRAGKMQNVQPTLPTVTPLSVPGYSNELPISPVTTTASAKRIGKIKGRKGQHGTHVTSKTVANSGTTTTLPPLRIAPQPDPTWHDVGVLENAVFEHALARGMGQAHINNGISTSSSAEVPSYEELKTMLSEANLRAHRAKARADRAEAALLTLQGLFQQACGLLAPQGPPVPLGLALSAAAEPEDQRKSGQDLAMRGTERASSAQTPNVRQGYDILGCERARSLLSPFLQTR